MNLRKEKDSKWIKIVVPFFKAKLEQKTCMYLTKRPFHNLSVFKGVRPNNFHAISKSIRINHKRIMAKANVYKILYDLLPLKFFEKNSAMFLYEN